MADEMCSDGMRDERDVVGWVTAAAVSRLPVGVLRRLVARGKLLTQRDARGQHVFDRRALLGLRPTGRPPAAEVLVDASQPSADVVQDPPPEAVASDAPAEPTAPASVAPVDDTPRGASAVALGGGERREPGENAIEELRQQLDSLSRRLDDMVRVLAKWGARVNRRLSAAESAVAKVERLVVLARQLLEEKIADLRDVALQREHVQVIVDGVIHFVVPLMAREALDVRRAFGQLALWLRVPWVPPLATFGVTSGVEGS